MEEKGFTDEGPYRDFGFGAALSYLKQGKRVCRVGWNGKRMWVEMNNPVGDITEPFLTLVLTKETNPETYTSGYRVPWVASQTDILAEDWMLYEEKRFWYNCFGEGIAGYTMGCPVTNDSEEELDRLTIIPD